MYKRVRLANIRKALIVAGFKDLAKTVELVSAADRSGAIPSEVIAVAKVAERMFQDLDLDYVLIGALGLSHLGYARYTEDVDILMTKASLDKLLSSDLSKYGFKVTRNGIITALQDNKYGIEVEILTSNTKLASDQEPLPDVHAVSQNHRPTLAGIIAMKLASFRPKDKNDILALFDKITDVIVNHLPEKLKKRFQALKDLSNLKVD